MNCPCCGNEMKEGFVRSGRAFFFAVEPHGLLYTPRRKKGEFCLSSHNFANPVCATWHCAQCEKVILDYTKEVE